ncbi:hypothetical protein KUCAC02_017777, partial [Chaenocephalus aceratus]
ERGGGFSKREAVKQVSRLPATHGECHSFSELKPTGPLCEGEALPSDTDNSTPNARQRRHCGGNLLWTHKGVTVSRGCQRLVTAGWFESMKNTLSGGEGGRAVRRS